MIAKPAYTLPLIVDTPNGKKDISEWASRQVKYKYWLCFRRGATEWNARFTYNDVSKLIPGTIYPLSDGLKYQFIVEKL